MYLLLVNIVLLKDDNVSLTDVKHDWNIHWSIASLFIYNVTYLIYGFFLSN